MPRGGKRFKKDGSVAQGRHRIWNRPTVNVVHKIPQDLISDFKCKCKSVIDDYRKREGDPQKDT